MDTALVSQRCIDSALIKVGCGLNQVLADVAGAQSRCCYGDRVDSDNTTIVGISITQQTDVGFCRARGTARLPAAEEQAVLYAKCRIVSDGSDECKQLIRVSARERNNVMAISLKRNYLRHCQ